jgi:hypothetical protein
MRWGLRSIFHAASAASLLVCALAMLLWIRSYFVADWLQVGNFTASTSAGDVEFNYFLSDAPARGRSGIHYGTNPPRSMRHKSLWGVQPALAPIGFAYDVVRDPKWRDYRAMVPLWFVALLGSILPTRWLYLYRGSWRKERRAARGLCLNCGYDMRMTPARCPECGAVREASATGSR